MLVVAGANIIVSSLIAKGFTLDMLFLESLEIVAPDWLFSEIEEHKDEILKLSDISEDELEVFMKLIRSCVRIFEPDEIKEHLDVASSACPDPDDVPYFALAMKLSCPVWSNDKKLKEQSEVKVLSTDELRRMLG
ncbi:MAG: hypothetical protein HY517_03125 [Candidatus Aenigmarchaeota archaeon]|nr:hypothetical protein [Candidatus Aenigmarchaeota archaeon]